MIAAVDVHDLAVDAAAGHVRVLGLERPGDVLAQPALAAVLAQASPGPTLQRPNTSANNSIHLPSIRSTTMGSRAAPLCETTFYHDLKSGPMPRRTKRR